MTGSRQQGLSPKAAESPGEVLNTAPSWWCCMQGSCWVSASTCFQLPGGCTGTLHTCSYVGSWAESWGWPLPEVVGFGPWSRR